MAEDPQSMEEVVEGLEEIAEQADEVSIGDILDEFGPRSFGPVLLFLPLVALSPLGGIPTVPTIFAGVIALIALQLLIGKEHIWLPGFIQDRAVKSVNLEWVNDKLGSTAERVDHWFHGRLEWLTHNSVLRLVALLVLGLCAMIPPLEVVPFAAAAPMVAIAAFGLAIMVRDGLLILIAGALSGGAIYMAFSLIGSSGGGG